MDSHFNHVGLSIMGSGVRVNGRVFAATTGQSAHVSGDFRAAPTAPLPRHANVHFRAVRVAGVGPIAPLRFLDQLTFGQLFMLVGHTQLWRSVASSPCPDLTPAGARVIMYIMYTKRSSHDDFPAAAEATEA
jgi:hypothetical protein